MKAIKLWLSCLFTAMFLMHFNAQAQDFAKNREMITSQENGKAEAQSSGYVQAPQSKTEVAQVAVLHSSYQKRTIQFTPVALHQQAARKANQKYRNGHFKRPKRNPKN